MNEEPFVRYIAWSPYCPQAFVARTEDAAKRAARAYILDHWSERTTWPSMKKAGWRVLRVDAQP